MSPRRRAVVRASSGDGREDAAHGLTMTTTKILYDGTVMFHVYDTLEAPTPIFKGFLEGALHVVEVARAHPNFVSSHFHYALCDGEKRIDDMEANSCFNYVLFDDVRAEDVWDAFEDFGDSIEMGHLNQTEHALACREIATYAPSNTDVRSALALTHAKRQEIVAGGKEAPVFGFDESNVVLFIGVKMTSGAPSVDSWMDTFGITDAESIVGPASFQDASLFEVATCSKRDETEHRFTHIARVSLGPCASDISKVQAAEDAIRKACEAIDTSVLVAPYACVYNIGKTGTPPGALPAVREMAKKKKEAEAQGYASAAQSN